MAVPSECFPESKEIQGMKEEVINRISFSYNEAVKEAVKEAIAAAIAIEEEGFSCGHFRKKARDCASCRIPSPSPSSS